MAEIKVEPKRSTAWIWIVVALVVLALIAWFVFANPGTDVIDTTTTGALTDLPALGPALT
jgi:bacteriorhodopsin